MKITFGAPNYYFLFQVCPISRIFFLSFQKGEIKKTFPRREKLKPRAWGLLKPDSEKKNSFDHEKLLGHRLPSIMMISRRLEEIYLPVADYVIFLFLFIDNYVYKESKRFIVKNSNFFLTSVWRFILWFMEKSFATIFSTVLRNKWFIFCLEFAKGGKWLCY